jgi:tetratricopeptide (TPR) repeat protein
MIQEVTRKLERENRAAEAIELYIVLETLFSAVGRHEEGLEAATHGAYLARAAGDQGALGRAEVGRGVELGALRRIREALAVLEAAIPLSEAAGDIYNLSRALDCATAFRKCRGEFKAASLFAERNLEVQQQGRNPWGIAMAHATRGGIFGFMGEWSHARGHCQRAEAMMRNLGFSSYSQYCMMEIAEFRLDEGRLDDVRNLAGEVLAATMSTGDLGYRDAARTLLARLDLLEGRPEQTRGLLSPRQDHPGLATGMLPTTLAMAHLDCGDLDAAQATVDEAIQLAQRGEARLVEAEARVVRGRLMTRREQWKTAEHDLQCATKMAAAMPYPHFHARALHELGLMYGAKGESHQARKHLEEALAIFQGLGAHSHVEHVSRALIGYRQTA